MIDDEFDRASEQRIDDATMLEERGDIDGSDAILEAVWQSLPEPKGQYPYVSQASAANGFIMNRDAGRFERARVWLDRAWEANPPGVDLADRQLLPYEATLRIAQDAPDAGDYTLDVLSRYGQDAFRNLGREYASFARAAAEADANPDG